MQIRAPFDGTIQTVTAQTSDALRPLQPGDAVTAGQALFTIAGEDGYIVKPQVDEQDIINVRARQPRQRRPAKISPAKPFRDTLPRIAPVATKSTDATSTAKQVLTTIRSTSRRRFSATA